MTRRATRADAEKVNALLALTANPSVISEDRLEAFAADRRMVVLVHDRECAIRLVRRRDADIIDIPMWVWRGDDVVAFVETLLAGLDECLRRWDCAAWEVGGTATVDPDQDRNGRVRESLKVARSWGRLLGSDVQWRIEPYNGLYRAYSTVGKMREAAATWLSANS